jgi:hypothetical protein
MPPIRLGVPRRHVDDVAAEADRLEDLRRAVAVERRDAHLRHDLQDAVAHRVPVGLLGLAGGGGVAAEPAGVGELGDRLQRQPRADRIGAVAEQAGERVGLPRVVGLAR